MNKQDLENVTKVIERTVNRAQLSACDEIMTRVIDRMTKYCNVMNSEEAETIFRNTYGARFDKMYDVRQRLYTKRSVLNDVLGIIYEVRKDYWDEYKAASQN